MLFKDIPGQEVIKKKLIQTVKDQRISHAQLFHGPEGSGKLALAVAYARYICCEYRTDSDSCGRCHSCVKYNKYIHPDLHFVFPSVSAAKKESDEEDSDNPKKSDIRQKWRDALIENPYLNQFQWYEKIDLENKQGLISAKEGNNIIRKLSLKPYESDYKVLIMWLPERLHVSAANKLLKIIEEPPPFTLFLLVSENYGEILPTILSRTQKVKIPPIRDEDIIKVLTGKYNTEPETAKDIAQLADGNFNKVISCLNEDENNKESFDTFVSLMRVCYANRIPEIITWVEKTATMSREEQKLFLLYALRMLRENYLMNLGKAELTHMAAYENEWSKKFSPFIHKRNIQGIYEELNLAYNHISSNGYARVVFLDMCLKLILLLKK